MKIRNKQHPRNEGGTPPTPGYNFDQRKKMPRCGAIIRVGEKYLMVKQRQSDKWGIPKGSPMPRELPEDCIARELKEETGIIIDPLNLKLKRFGVGETNSNWVATMPKYLVAVINIPSLKSLQKSSSNEISEIQLFTEEELVQSKKQLNASGLTLLSFLRAE